MSESDGLVCAYRLDGAGGGENFDDWASLPAANDKALDWIHLNREAAHAQEWLVGGSGLRPLVREALVADDTRPQCSIYDEGVLLNLRGLNLNPGAEPEHMISVRLWLEPSRIISTRRNRLMAIRDVRDALESRKGPRDIGAFVIMVADRLTARMEPLLDEIQDRLDELEDDIIADTRRELRNELARLRRRTILLRRYISPQRDALRTLANSEIEWLTRRQRDRLNEIADRVTRYVEDLDVVRDRAAILQDELTSMLSESMNRTMYLLSIVAVVFLPLTLVSGMLGMNVGGIPGEKWPWAFAFLCVAFLVVGLLEWWLIRKLKWL